MSPTRRTHVLLFAALCLTGCAGSSPPGPMYFGHIAALTGPEHAAGEAAVRGIRLAVMEANKDPEQGAGRVVKVLHTDTLGAGDAFEAEAVRLVTVNHVAALLGGTTPEEVEHLERARVPVVSPCGARPQTRSELVFCAGLAPEQQGKLLARFAAEHLQVKQAMALAAESHEGSVTLAEAFAHGFQTAGATKGVKSPATRPPVLRFGKEIKLAELVKRVRAEKPAAVLLAGTVADLRALRLGLGEKGPVVLFGGDDGSVRPLRETGEPGAVYVVTAFVADADVPRAKEFVKKYRETFSEDPDVHAALAYDTTRLLFEAVRRTKDNLTSARLRDELAGIKDFPGLTGPLSFGADRHLLRPAFVVRIEGGQAKTEKRYAAGE